ncbi:hypothetical protein BKA70DRAFT_1188675 [Coprinopsis sp. MPI-PUGE-AT-0042]|nr:hypothetical protein BKA70DRAFT_1188675 [Coprinopsis sp. MPI-PUGE-AT-0042]
MLPPQNYVAWKVCITVLHGLAIGATVLRIWIRWKDAKLWWDDYVAAATMLMDVAFAITFWLMFGTHAGSSMTLGVTEIGWLNIAAYFLIFWASRVSLALSIARVFPAGTMARRSLVAMVALFFFFCIFTCVLDGSLCIWSPAIYPPEMMRFGEYKNCQPGTLRYSLAGGITVAAHFLSDIMAIIVPLIFLWRITLPPSERRLVHGAVSANTLTALSGGVACAFWYAQIDLGQDFRIIVAGAIHQQAAICLISCNLLVVVTYWWRKVYRRNRPTPRRYRYNDPNIPTSKTSSESPSSDASASRSNNARNGKDLSLSLRQSFHLEASSRLPANLSFTPITPLSAESASSPVWADSRCAKACTPACVSMADSHRVPIFKDPPPPPLPHTRNYT